MNLREPSSGERQIVDIQGIILDCREKLLQGGSTVYGNSSSMQAIMRALKITSDQPFSFDKSHIVSISSIGSSKNQLMREAGCLRPVKITNLSIYKKTDRTLRLNLTAKSTVNLNGLDGLEQELYQKLNFKPLFCTTYIMTCCNYNCHYCQFIDNFDDIFVCNTCKTNRMLCEEVPAENFPIGGAPIEKISGMMFMKDTVEKEEFTVACVMIPEIMDENNEEAEIENGTDYEITIWGYLKPNLVLVKNIKYKSQ